MPAGEEFFEMRFPVAGVDQSAAFSRQPSRDVGRGVYGRSTPEGVNVRAYEASSLRRRGGRRSGLSRYISAPVVADWIVQELAAIVTTNADAEA